MKGKHYMTTTKRTGTPSVSRRNQVIKWAEEELLTRAGKAIDEGKLLSWDTVEKLIAAEIKTLVEPVKGLVEHLTGHRTYFSQHALGVDSRGFEAKLFYSAISTKAATAIKAKVAEVKKAAHEADLRRRNLTWYERQHGRTSYTNGEQLPVELVGQLIQAYNTYKTELMIAKDEDAIAAIVGRVSGHTFGK
jgi:hypothetical protein|tara:strand:+ start:1021 stop:1593 length:573 start_codon:yes stop_codon:yes gene_type:complete